MNTPPCPAIAKPVFTDNDPDHRFLPMPNDAERCMRCGFYRGAHPEHVGRASYDLCQDERKLETERRAKALLERLAQLAQDEHTETFPMPAPEMPLEPQPQPPLTPQPPWFYDLPLG